MVQEEGGAWGFCPISFYFLKQSYVSWNFTFLFAKPVHLIFLYYLFIWYFKFVKRHFILHSSYEKERKIKFPSHLVSYIYSFLPVSDSYQHVMGILSMLWSDGQRSQALVWEVGFTFSWLEGIMEFPGRLRKERPLGRRGRPGRLHGPFELGSRWWCMLQLLAIISGFYF